MPDIRSEPVIDNPDVFDDPLFTPKGERSKTPVSTPVSKQDHKFIEEEQYDAVNVERAPSKYITVYGDDEDEAMDTTKTSHELGRSSDEESEGKCNNRAVVFWVSQLRRV